MRMAVLIIRPNASSTAASRQISPEAAAFEWRIEPPSGVQITVDKTHACTRALARSNWSSISPKT